MKLEIRRLDPVADGHLYDLSYSWLMSSPSWRQQTEAVFGTLDYTEYMNAVHDPGRCDVGIFVEGVLTAIITLTIRAKGVYEVHLEAAPHTPPEAIMEAGLAIKAQMFGVYGAQLAYTWTPSWNRAVLAIDKAIGFEDTGVRMLHGTCRGRLIEWVELSVRANYGKPQTDANADAATEPEPGIQHHERLQLDDATGHLGYPSDAGLPVPG